MLQRARIWPIGEFLYKMSGSLEGKKEALVERETQVQRAQAKCHYVGAASLKILERLRQRGFKQVFDALDDNKVKRSPNLDVLWGCMLCHFRYTTRKFKS